MMTNQFRWKSLAATAALALLASCAAVQAPNPQGAGGGTAPPGRCGINPNCADVYVGIDSQGKSTIIVDPSIQRNKGARPQTWKIVSKGFTFPANGIEFPNDKIQAPGVAGTIHLCQRSLRDPTEFTCQNSGTKGTYGYWVRLTPTTPGPNDPPALDPIIMND